MTTSTVTETTTDATPREDRVPPAPTLTIVHHPEPRWVGERCVLGGVGVELGRESAAFGAGALAHARISRRHARLTVQGGGLVVEDLGSHNGTALNGDRVARAIAAPGDVIEVGPVLILFHVAPSAYTVRRSERFAGRSAALGRVLDSIDAVAGHPTTTLVLGETGTGKELVAREIHERSGRSGAFVAVNCGSLASGLLQSELFGHERGAFSGATSARRGLFEAAHEGTLLLDEIGDAPADVQIALLRVLQEREVRPLGAARSIPVDARIVAATHQDLPRLVAAGRFREDLLARLTPWVIELPPLRARADDVPHLAAAILRRLGEPRRLHRSATLALVRAPYPRNVRQLEAAVERMVREARPDDAELRLTDGARDLLTAPAPAPATAPAPAPATAPAPAPATAPAPHDRASLERLLRDHHGNVTRAAQQLGVGRNTLYRWLREASVSLEDVRGTE